MTGLVVVKMGVFAKLTTPRTADVTSRRKNHRFCHSDTPTIGTMRNDLASVFTRYRGRSSPWKSRPILLLTGSGRRQVVSGGVQAAWLLSQIPRRNGADATLPAIA